MSFSARTYVNPQHVREVTLHGDVCRITPVAYTWTDVPVSSVFTHAEDPVRFAACVGVHKFFEKQRTSGSDKRSDL